MNLFGTVLTYAAPSANYRGEGAENRSVIQKISKGRFEYAIMSPEAIRNAVRETLAEMNLPCNRERLHDEEQLAVRFKEYPDADKYADDFFMGWLIAANARDRTKILAELSAAGRSLDQFSFKRDSIIRMNMAVALEPYRFNSVFTQSPLHVDSPWKNADSSQLLHRETSYTAFQFPFALNIEDCRKKTEWTRKLLQAIGQLNNVAGNHARSYFEMAPASIVLRLTSQLVAGYDTYGFRAEEDGSYSLPEIVEGIIEGDYDGTEFFLGGELIKNMTEDLKAELKEKGVRLQRTAQQALKEVGESAFSG